MNECLYFAEGVLTTLVSLRALKNLGCVSQNFPYPEAESVLSLTNRDDRDNEDDDKEDVIKPREPIPDKPEEIPLPPTEKMSKKLRAWLVEHFSASSFNTFPQPTEYHRLAVASQFTTTIRTASSEIRIFLTLVKINFHIRTAIPPLVVVQSTNLLPFWKAT